MNRILKINDNEYTLDYTEEDGLMIKKEYWADGWEMDIIFIKPDAMKFFKTFVKELPES